MWGDCQGWGGEVGNALGRQWRWAQTDRWGRRPSLRGWGLRARGGKSPHGGNSKSESPALRRPSWWEGAGRPEQRSGERRAPTPSTDPGRAGYCRDLQGNEESLLLLSETGSNSGNVSCVPHCRRAQQGRSGKRPCVHGWFHWASSVARSCR